jgi:hypothetical protein
MKHPMLAVIFLSCLSACGDDEGGSAGIDSGELPSIDAAVGGPDASPTGTPDAAPSGEDLDMKAEDFECITDGTLAGKTKLYYVWNKLGHLDEALAVANDPAGGTFPVGTVLQLVPFEAMVKRKSGWSPETKDWEFFALEASASGTVIKSRGTTQVVNFANGNCFGCHSGAEAKFDMVCEKTHGCDPLPDFVNDDLIKQFQEDDARCP